jgi:hypothetical protein
MLYSFALKKWAAGRAKTERKEVTKLTRKAMAGALYLREGTDIY